ncbi:hypothetical protein [Lysinibacillus sp. C5.1]|uniref:hypothetical protein n=1 Tax=Lysinibacillus sp. C5.1 TaxID=2796169 RepID=UPI0030816A9B
MTTSSARCHSTGTTTWKDSLSIAGNTGTNPIGTTLWFNANDTYKARTLQFS